jgi:TolB-like protein
MKFFGEGIAECLIQALSELPGIRKVIARNSAFKYADSDPLEAGRMLGVRAVLTGRLRISRKSACLTAELVDAADSAHLWGTVIDRPFKEIAHSQAHLADEICAAVSPKLPGKQPQVGRGRRVGASTRTASTCRVDMPGASGRRPVLWTKPSACSNLR